MSLVTLFRWRAARVQAASYPPCHPPHCPHPTLLTTGQRVYTRYGTVRLGLGPVLTRTLALTLNLTLTLTLALALTPTLILALALAQP